MSDRPRHLYVVPDPEDAPRGPLRTAQTDAGILARQIRAAKKRIARLSRQHPTNPKRRQEVTNELDELVASVRAWNEELVLLEQMGDANE